MKNYYEYYKSKRHYFDGYSSGTSYIAEYKQHLDLDLGLDWSFLALNKRCIFLSLLLPND